MYGRTAKQMDGSYMDGPKVHMALSSLCEPQGILNGNDLRPTVNPSIQNPNASRILIKRRSWKIRTLVRIFLYGKDLLRKHNNSNLCHYKNPKTLRKQVRIIYLLWHSRVVKNSNLTFRGYLASTTPVLSVRSSLFVLCRCCFEHVRTVLFTVDFPASSNIKTIQFI